MADKPISAVILDNHGLFVNGVGELLARADPSIGFVDAHASLIEAWTGAGGDADVVIFDLGLVKERRFEFDALAKLIDRGRNLVVLSAEEDDQVILHCVRMGVRAYVTKTESQEHLVPAIRAAADGNPYITPALAGAMAVDGSPDRPQLTRQELAILKLWSGGMPKALVAKRLKVTTDVVDEDIDRARKRYNDIRRSAPPKSASRSTGDLPYTGPPAHAMAVDSAPTRPPLTDREIEICRVWCGGGSKPDVARRMNLAPRTVREYVERARDKYKAVGRPARSKAAMTLRLIEDGFITAGDVEPPEEE